MEQQLTALAIGAVLGFVYSVYGYATKHEQGESFKPKKAARTVVMWTVAGAVIGVSEGIGAVGERSIEQMATELSMLGILFDMAWSKLEKEMPDVIPSTD